MPNWPTQLPTGSHHGMQWPTLRSPTRHKSQGIPRPTQLPGSHAFLTLPRLRGCASGFSPGEQWWEFRPSLQNSFGQALAPGDFYMCVVETDPKAILLTWSQPLDVNAAIETFVNDVVFFDTIPSMSDFLSIVREKQGDSEMPYTRLFFVKTNRYMLNAAVASGIHGDRQQLRQATQKRASRQADPFFKGVWLPAALVEHALPRLAHSFRPQKKLRMARLNPGFTRLVSFHTTLPSNW